MVQKLQGAWWLGVLLSIGACRPTHPAVPAPPAPEPEQQQEPRSEPPQATAPSLTWLEPLPHIVSTLELRPPTPVTERREFPLSAPALGGYTLHDEFAGADLVLPSAVVWPKVSGAPTLLLDRRGYVLELTAGGSRRVLSFPATVALSSEDGALGMALHPAFGDGTGPKPWVFIWYNAVGSPRHTQRLSRFTWDAQTRTLPRASELILVEEAEERALHNAGHIQFGPDGFLYFGNGDDLNTANHQRVDRALFAGLFRIDVDSRGGTVSHPPPRQPEGGHTQGYFIPNDNPFVGVPNAMEEFFALGFRNPYGFSFDRQTGALWAADVGDTWREEIDLVVKGANAEWPYREGDVLRGTVPPTLGTPMSPKFTYTHAEMGDLTSVLGGYIYRGSELPELTGQFIYTDWPSCRVWALSVNSPAITRATLVDTEVCSPTGLAEDEQGELYLMAVGRIAKLTRSNTASTAPRFLSQTTLFSNVVTLQPEPKLVPYEIASPLWSDGADKQRWIAVPPGQQVSLGADGGVVFPVGTTFVKQFDLPASVSPANRTRRLETRVLVVGSQDTYGLSYRWNAAGTDAELVHEPADEALVDGAGQALQTWHFPGFGQCFACHRQENRVLGFTPRQLNITRTDGSAQLAALVASGVFSAATAAAMPEGLPRISDTSTPLEARALSYLAANCSSCHHPGASYLGGEETWNALPGFALEDRGLVGARHHNGPMARALGLGTAPLIAPGNPDGSLLLARMKSTNPDLRMPPLGRNEVDLDGTALIEHWIRSLPQP